MTAHRSEIKRAVAIAALLAICILALATPQWESGSAKLLQSSQTGSFDSDSIALQSEHADTIPGEFWVSMGPTLETYCPPSQDVRSRNPEAESAIDQRIKAELGPLLPNLVGSSDIAIHSEVLCMSGFVLLKFTRLNGQMIDLAETDVSRLVSQSLPRGLVKPIRTKDELTADFWAIVERIENLKSGSGSQQSSAISLSPLPISQDPSRWSEDWTKGLPSSDAWVSPHSTGRSAEWSPNDPLHPKNRSAEKRAGMNQLYNWCARGEIEQEVDLLPYENQPRVSVAIIDSGASNLIFGPKVQRVSHYCTARDNASCNLTLAPKNSSCPSHGTVVASTIAATANDAIGIAGIAPVDIVDINNYYKDNTPDELSLLRALELIVELQHDYFQSRRSPIVAINLSEFVMNAQLRFIERSPICRVLDRANDKMLQLGAPLVIGAGNSYLNEDDRPGVNLDSLDPYAVALAPQMCAGARVGHLNVAALAPGNDGDFGKLAWYSNYGAYFVDVAAELFGVVDGLDPKDPSRLIEGGFKPSGTSLAAPVITGMIAAHAWFNRVHNLNPKLASDQFPGCLPSISYTVDSGVTYQSSPWSENLGFNTDDFLSTGLVNPYLIATKSTTVVTGNGSISVPDYDEERFKVRQGKTANLCSWATGCGRAYLARDCRVGMIHPDAPWLTRACNESELIAWGRRECEDVCMRGASIGSNNSSSSGSSSHQSSNQSSGNSSSSSQSSTSSSSSSSSSSASSWSMSVTDLPRYELEDLKTIDEFQKELRTKPYYLCKLADGRWYCCVKGSSGDQIQVPCDSSGSSGSSHSSQAANG